MNTIIASNRKNYSNCF